MTKTTTYPSNETIYTECAWLADDLNIDLWEDEEDGRRVFKIVGDNGRTRTLTPAHCYDELTNRAAS